MTRATAMTRARGPEGGASPTSKRSKEWWAGVALYLDGIFFALSRLSELIAPRLIHRVEVPDTASTNSAHAMNGNRD